jgi:hypothetical protein
MKRFTVNKATAKTSHLLHVVNASTREKVRRVNEDGKEFIIVSSATLPDDVVMNRKLYPADVIAATFESLNRTHAPVEHPKNRDGEYISATDPEAYANGYIVGAVNVNVRRENGRVWLDKRIDVEQAMKSERGKRLLDRVEMLEQGKIDSIHTSTGIFTKDRTLDAPETNAAGEEYDVIVEDMVFDHDAILLDSIAAATPDKGVGIGVNSKARVDGLQINASMYVNETLEHLAEGEEVDNEMISNAAQKIMGVIGSLFPNRLKVAKHQTDCNNTPDDAEKSADILTNQEGDAMRETMIAALKAKGVTVNASISDADLLDKYNQSLAVNAQGDDEDTETNADYDKDADANKDEEEPESNAGDSEVMNAIKALSEKVDAMQSKMSANENASRKALIADLESADVGLTAKDMKSMQTNALEKLHTRHCGEVDGVFISANRQQGRVNENAVKLDLPQ